MIKRIFAGLFVLVLTLSFSLASFAQDAAKQEMKKDEKKMEMSKSDMSKAEMTKEEAAMGPLKSLSCDEACGFMIRSRDEKEIMSAAKSHIKKVHKMKATEKELKEKIKTEEAMKK